MTILDLAAFDATPLTRDPFDFTIVENFIRPAEFKPVIADFPAHSRPRLASPGGTVDQGPLQGSDGRDGRSRPSAPPSRRSSTSTSPAGPPCTRCAASCRTATAISTPIPRPRSSRSCSILNEGWEEEGGRLRLLRSNESLDNPVAEVSPNGGTLLVFRRVRQFLARPQDLQGAAPRHPAQLGDGGGCRGQRAAAPRLRDPRQEAEEHVPADGELKLGSRWPSGRTYR